MRETFRLFDSSRECACYDDCVCSRNHGKPVYRADYDSDDRWTPSIFMLRAASRLTLEITGVRVERLQGISEADCYAEGIEATDFAAEAEHLQPATGVLPGRYAYRALWESINGPGSWAANPWVWVVEFSRVPQ